MPSNADFPGAWVLGFDAKGPLALARAAFFPTNTSGGESIGSVLRQSDATLFRKRHKSARWLNVMFCKSFQEENVFAMMIFFCKLPKYFTCFIVFPPSV